MRDNSERRRENDRHCGDQHGRQEKNPATNRLITHSRYPGDKSTGTAELLHPIQKILDLGIVSKQFAGCLHE